MSRVYDNWERLVAAVLKREQLRQLAVSHSISSSISADFSSRFSFASSHEDLSASRASTEAISPEARILSHRDVRPIEFKELKKATKNFRSDLILGEGGFGPVFKGWIDEKTLTATKPGSGMPVAVKKWIQGGFQGREEWLVGTHNQSLPWATRIKVAIGAARVLSFLHDQEKPVITRSFKTADILLNAEFNAKLSDLGLAKDGPTGDMTHVSTRVMGHLTEKCDVYSFGVVLLELLSGRRVIDATRASEEQNLAEWAQPYLRDKRKLLLVMDPKLEGQYPHNEAYTVATVALQCLSAKPKQRPRMAEVAELLDLSDGMILVDTIDIGGLEQFNSYQWLDPMRPVSVVSPYD
ncbi:hypothetical protein DH2020_048876 [Rehmannia glutinosa]|uniref:Protein kinase domain-containing protein n=1 Tax=Rehmannia glutinosa TaxID=99300 RepID=A0ABR0U4B5_REHGL